MKKFLVLSFAFLTVFTSYTQSRDDVWYLMDKDNLWEFVIKNDTLKMYPDVPFDLKVKEPRLIGTMVVLSEKKTINGTSTYHFVAVHDKDQTGEISFTPDSSAKNERLLFSAIPYHSNEKITPAIILVSPEEIKSYGLLKNISEMTDDDFIKYAQKVDSLLVSYHQDPKGISNRHLRVELKLIIAGLGYNPLVNMKELNEALKKFETRPATSQIAKSYRH